MRSMSIAGASGLAPEEVRGLLDSDDASATGDDDDALLDIPEGSNQGAGTIVSSTGLGSGSGSGARPRDDARPLGFQTALNASGGAGASGGNAVSGSADGRGAGKRQRLPGRIKRNFQALTALVGSERSGSPSSHLGFLRRRTPQYSRRTSTVSNPGRL
eukprot:Opistho-2@49446